MNQRSGSLRESLPIFRLGKSMSRLLAAFLLTAPLLHAAPGATAVLGEAASTPNFVGAWSGTASYSVNDVVSYGGSLYINTVATAPATVTTTTPGTGNLFDASAIATSSVVYVSNGTLANIGGFGASGFVNLGGASTFVSNITIGIFDPYGMAFYDSNKKFVSGSLATGNGFIPGGTPIAIPSGATYVRFWWQEANMGTAATAAIVNTGTTLQTTYTPFGATSPGNTTTTTTPSAVPTDTSHWAVYTNTTTTTPTATTTPAGPWAGKKMFMLADSIIWANPAVAGQIASVIGAVPSSQGATAPGVDAFPGRGFDSFTNGQSSTGAYVPLSASVIADVDLMVIALGTNQDSPLGLGSVTDAPSLNGTMSAQMRAMLETIMGWKPGMRIIVVGPYQSGRYDVPSGIDGLSATWYPNYPANAASLAVLKNINTAMKAVCNYYAIPYVDMFNESGVNFSTYSIWLQDGLHPTGLGYSTFYVPYVAASLARYAQ